MTGSEDHRLDSMLAGLLYYGTWLASGLIGAGLVMTLVGADLGRSGMGVVEGGVALFIALPVLRVLLMLGYFARSRDWRLVLIASMVLMTILAGLVIGLSLPSAPTH